MKNETAERTERFRKGLLSLGLDGALLVQTADVFYLSGTDQDAHLWVPLSAPPLLMVRKSLERAREDSPLENIVPLAGFSRIPDLMKEGTKQLPKRLGLEMDVVPAAHYLTYKELFPETEIVDISPLIRKVRMVKSPYEISCTEGAAKMADEMYEQVPAFLEEAETETDLAVRVEGFYRSKGHPGVVRVRGFNSTIHYGHIISGKSAALPSSSPGPTGGEGLGPFYSQGAGMGKILNHSPIVVDYAANVEGYIADQARVFSIGTLTDRWTRAHDVMLEIQDAVARKGRPGVRAGDLYDRALKIAEKEGLQDGFMGYPDPVPFVGHGVGLEIDEWPVIGKNSETVLEEGMVVALEPKVVFPGEGVVGIENVFQVTGNGMKKLNKYPDDIRICGS